MPPKVSFVIPVYNAEQYLRQCLDSVLIQSMPDFEAIVVDDGSTDGSAVLLDEYSAKDPRIHCFHISNRGPSGARNFGIEMAQGEFVSFLDADDYLLPDFLTNLLRDRQGAELCVGTRLRYYQNRERMKRFHCRPFSGSKRALRKQVNHYLRELRGATGRLYLRSVITERGVRFQENIRYAEDMKFDYLFLSFCTRVTFTDRADYVYRIHNPNSLSQLDNTFFLKQWRMQSQCIRQAFRE